MYNTIIRQQHIIDRTEQERLLLSFIAQKYYKTKWSITELRNAHPVLRMMLLKHGVTAHRLRSPLSPHREEKYRGKRYCWEVYQICESVYFEPFLWTVLNLSNCALLKSLTVTEPVVTARFECWTEDDRQTAAAAERKVHVDLNLTLKYSSVTLPQIKLWNSFRTLEI